MTTELTAERLRELLMYDPETGDFIRRVRVAQRSKAGDIAGGASKIHGYVSIRVDGCLYKAHRLAWLYVHGKWPDGQIDHLNGIRADNRIANLRDVTPSVNCQNRRRPHSNNRSGLLGVRQYKGGRWHAQIWVDNTQRHLGYFSTPEEAHAAYLQAKRDLQAGCTI